MSWTHSFSNDLASFTYGLLVFTCGVYYFKGSHQLGLFRLFFSRRPTGDMLVVVILFTSPTFLYIVCCGGSGADLRPRGKM